MFLTSQTLKTRGESFVFQGLAKYKTPVGTDQLCVSVQFDIAEQSKLQHLLHADHAARNISAASPVPRKFISRRL